MVTFPEMYLVNPHRHKKTSYSTSFTRTTPIIGKIETGSTTTKIKTTDGQCSGNVEIEWIGCYSGNPGIDQWQDDGNQFIQQGGIFAQRLTLLILIYFFRSDIDVSLQFTMTTQRQGCIAGNCIVMMMITFSERRCRGGGRDRRQQ